MRCSSHLISQTLECESSPGIALLLSLAGVPDLADWKQSGKEIRLAHLSCRSPRQ